MATITVLEARNLISTDPNGLSDPYCLIGVADPQTGNFVDKKGCIRSETKRWTLTPSWKKGILEVNKRPSVVRVEIWDKDEDKEDDFVGLALIKLDSVKNTEDRWVTLLTKHGKENKLGDIHVTVQIHQAGQGTPAIVQQTTQKAQAVPVHAQATAKPAATTQQTTAPPPTSAIPHVTGKPHPSAVPHPTTTPTTTAAPVSAIPIQTPATAPQSATAPQPTTTPARPVSAIPAPAQTTTTPSQSTSARPTPTTTPAPTPTPAHPTPAQTTSRPTPAPQPATTPVRPAPTPQPTAPAQVVTASAPKPAQPPANAAEIQKKNSDLAQKHAKLAATYHAQGAIMEALEHYNLSSALFARAFGSGDRRAIATEQCATQLMMEISFGAFMA